MSGFTDTTLGVRAINARTDAAGDPVTDITAEEDRFANLFVAEGFISPADAFEPVGDTAFNIDIGSGATDVDYYVVEGQGVGQGNYVVRLDQAGDVVTVGAADLSNDRLDEIYLVVMDHAYDSSGLVLPRLAVRNGDPGPTPALPGPDPSWLAYAVIATVLVPAGAADITECTVTDVRIQSQSNVDAPTLEGLAAAAFALDTHDHDATYQELAHVSEGDGHADVGGSPGMMSATLKSKLNAVATGAEANLSAAEVLTLIKTVDGSGSGLDADLLDGAQGSTFAASGLLHDGTYYTEAEMNTKLATKSAATGQVHVYRTNTQNFLSGFEGQLLLSFEINEDWEGHTNPDSFITDGDAGFYLVEAQMIWEAESGGTIRQIRLHHNEDGNVAFGRERPIQSAEATIVTCETVVFMDGNDKIQMFVYQDSGVTIGNLAPDTYLKLTYIGAGG